MAVRGVAFCGEVFKSEGPGSPVFVSAQPVCGEIRKGACPAWDRRQRPGTSLLMPASPCPFATRKEVNINSGEGDFNGEGVRMRHSA
jgi:hypothetical protein